MEDKARVFIRKLTDIELPGPETQSLEARLSELLDELGEVENPTQVFPAVFQFFETYPFAELGEPGPLVHFLERSFPGGYETLLLNSLARRPTPRTLWMANRLLNSSQVSGELRANLNRALEIASDHPLADPSTRADAMSFIEFQRDLGD